MKTAVLLIGNVRTWEMCKDNFKETFSHLNPDIFISTSNIQYNHHPYIRGKINDHTDYLLGNSVIEKMFSDLNVKHLEIEDGTKGIDMSDLHPNFRELQTSFSQYQKFQRIMQVIEDSDVQYDCVIKTRCDLILNPIEMIELSTNIIVDSGNVFPNDCVFITNQKSMINMSNFIVDEFYDPKYPDSHLDAPHKLLRNSILSEGLNIVTQKIMNHVIRKNGIKQYY